MSSPTEEDKKRMWMKYYCEECKAWETRELFEAKLGHGPQPLPATSTAFWSWGCSKLIHTGSFQSFQVEQLNEADGHDAVPKLDFPSVESPVSQPASEQKRPRSNEAGEELASAPQTVHAAQSNGSSQSKRPKRNVRSTYLHDSVADTISPINSQGGVTSSSPDEVLPDENGASTIHAENRSKDSPSAAGPESPAVIDAEHHENGIHKRPRRLTAGDRGLAQALQYEKPAKRVATKPLAEVNNVKPSQPPSLAAMKRPKRVTAGLRGILLSADNAKSASRVSPKNQKTDDVHGVRTRSTAKKASKNRKLGDLY